MQPDATLLIGINGSGKSNFFKAIRLLQEGISGKGLRPYIFENLGGFDNIIYKGNHTGDKSSVEIEYCIDGELIARGNYGYHFIDDIIYTIKIVRTPGTQNYQVQEKIITKNRDDSAGIVYLDFTAGSGVLNEAVTGVNTKTNLVRYSDFNAQELVLREISDSNRYYALTTLRKALKDVLVYYWFDTMPMSAIRGSVLATSDKRLSATGGNLAQILNTIKINSKEAYRKIVAMLTEVNPNFIGFDFNVIGGGNIELMLDERGLDSSVHVSNISDGTLKYLCLLAVLYNQERGKVICIDEPEVGLHPDMIANVAKAIREAAEDSAIIISTHSSDLLNYFNFDHLRVFEKDEDNATRVSTYSEEQFAGWYDEFALGEMWKAGDFGGVRYGG